jgi:hypothetical protein
VNIEQPEYVTIYFKATEKDKKSHAVKIAIWLNFIGEEGLEVYNTFTIPQDAAIYPIRISDACL